MKNQKFIVALFQRDKLKLAFECDSRNEVEELISNTLSKKDGFMYYDDEIIENFKKDDEDYDSEFYTGEGWYHTNSEQVVWVPGEENRISIDIYRFDVFENEEIVQFKIYRFDVFENEEIVQFKEKYPDIYLHAFNGNSLL